MKPKLYLGDGIYAEVKYDELILTTEDGIETTNIIILEPQIYHALEVYMSSNGRN
jgi:hypothetical protein